LGRNYISQHRFRDALFVLSKAEFTGEKLIESQKMLFDVHMELGNYALAGCYLAEISKVADFDYFIRMAKWQDYLGELDHAIHFMELALDQAVRMNNQKLIVWSYTNLGDFYGHANRIEEAYELYVRTLEIDPGNVYAIKQIAWIAYSYEKNPDKALQILESLEKRYTAPDLLLLKSDILEYQGKTTFAKGKKKEFMHKVSSQDYGRMYNTYLIEIQIENKEFEKAIALAENEVSQRSTPETNGLLAWSYYHSGSIDKAFSILNDKVIGQTFEPIPLYCAAVVIKEKGEFAMVEKIKKDLIESAFEVGPLMEHKIKEL
jgi:tetratricopeptide (TPR) repeat protein